MIADQQQPRNTYIERTRKTSCKTPNATCSTTSFRSGELFEFVCADPRSSRLAATSTRLPIAIIPTGTGNPNAVPVVAAEMMISVIMAVVTISVVAPVIVISRSRRRNKTRNAEHHRKY